MKPRPRQIDSSKPFNCVDNVERFLQAEGQELDASAANTIITPDMVNTNTTKEIKPKAPQEETVRKVHPPNFKEEYNRYKIPPYPDQNMYEIIEEDYQFLKSFNSKVKTHEITVEDFEQFLSLIDLKSGKDVIIDYPSFLNTLQQSNSQLPHSISQLPSIFQQELYGYWKKYREHLQRPLVRSLQHPYLEETNPHLAFRPRQAPNDRTMKLRRGGAVAQIRGLSEMDQTSQKVISLKEDMNRAQQLLEICLNREKAMEIERRGSFCKFVKKVQEEFKGQPDQAQELKIWLKECFVKDTERCAINITRIDEMIDHVSKDMQSWREEQEKIRREYEKKEDGIKRTDQLIKNISSQHHTAITNQQQIPYEAEYPPYVEPQMRNSRKKIIANDDLVNTKDIMSREYLEERRESVAKFISTLYLEARQNLSSSQIRKFHLTADKVVSQTSSLSTFTPQNKEIPKQTHVPHILPQNLTTPVPEPNSVPIRKNIIPYQLLQAPGSDLVYRLPFNHHILNKFGGDQESLWQNYQDIQQDLLYRQFDYFKNKTDDLMEMADMDQMLYNQLGDDDRHEEEELKVLRKKLKLSQNKGQINGVIKA